MATTDKLKTVVVVVVVAFVAAGSGECREQESGESAHKIERVKQNRNFGRERAERAI